MSNWMAWSAGLVVVFGLAGIAMIRSVSHDPDTWHVDPASTSGTGRPNEALAAPPGTTRLESDIKLPTTARPARDLLAALDAAARAEPRVEVVAGSIDTGRITYVQRSAIMGFPDYVSVSTIQTSAGDGLILWSRSRFGHSDLGVNRARLERWLSAAELL